MRPALPWQQSQKCYIKRITQTDISDEYWCKNGKNILLGQIKKSIKRIMLCDQMKFISEIQDGSKYKNQSM